MLTKLLSIIYQQTWLTGEVPPHRKLRNMTPIYKKDQEEDSCNYKPVSLTLVMGKVMGHNIFSQHRAHVGHHRIRSSLFVFMKGSAA